MRCTLITIFLLLVVRLAAQTPYPLQPAVEGFEFIEVIKGETKKDMPLLIAFHYSGSNPVETVPDYDSLKNAVRIIIPKGNYKKREGFSYFPTDYYQMDSAAQFTAAKKIVDSLAVFVRSIEKIFGQKAIVGGASQGGDIALMLAIYYPELCKASFPVAAVIHSRIVSDLKHTHFERIPIYLFQGDADKIVNVAYTRRKVNELNNLLQIKLTTYPGLGHDISAQEKADYAKLIDEINKQKQ